MVKVPEVFVVRKGREWLQSSRPDLIGAKLEYIWSPYLYNAKQLSSRSEARIKARKTGGTVYRFNPVTGDAVSLKRELPPGAICDTCRGYTAWDGACINPESEYYRTNVSYMDVCEDWRAKDGRENKD